MPAKPLTPEQIEDAARLKAIFEQRKIETGLTQEVLAEACGWKTQGAVYQYLNARIPLNVTAAAKFAMALKVQIADFSPALSKQVLVLNKPMQGLGLYQSVARGQREYHAVEEGVAHYENTEPGPNLRAPVPLISWVTAGAFDTANDPLLPGEAEEWLPTPRNSGKHTYALRVRGDSMTAPHGKSYPDGCIIFVDPEKRSPSTGDRIIAKLDGTDEVTFKQFISDAGRMWLKPLNPQYPLITEQFRVLGTIIGKWEDE